MTSRPDPPRDGRRRGAGDRDLGPREEAPSPRYSLREPTIARLAAPYLGRPPLLDRDAAAEERGLLSRCRDLRAVGLDEGRPIRCDYLLEHLPMPRRDLHPNLGWTDRQWEAAEQAVAKVLDVKIRMKGWAGWLLTEPAYLDGVRDLEARWRRLAEGARPSFPLRRPAPAATLAGETRPPRCPDAVAGFVEDLEDLLDRWGLVGLASWDLPEPQGPLFPSLLPPGAPAVPRHGLHIVLPIHYALTGDDDLLGQIRSLQRGMAEDLGLDRTAAGLPHFRAYATILEVAHWEKAILRRFPALGRPRGFAGHVVEAIAETIGLEVNQVLKWRKAISACRRGGRRNVRALRVLD